MKTPTSTAVASFFGSPPGCLLPATYNNGRYQCLGQTVALDLPPGFTAELELYYRSQSLELRSYPTQPPCPATVTEALPIAGHWQYRVQVQRHAFDLVNSHRIDPQAAHIGIELPAQPAAIFCRGNNLQRKKIVLVRHAMSEWNQQGRLQGQADPRLAQQATAQLQKLQGQLQQQTFARVETSPLMRACDSAALLGYDKTECIPGWKEIDVGSWQGQLITELDPNHYRAWRAGQFTPVGGEIWLDFCRRIEAELNRLIARDGNSLVICHGGVIRACLQILFNQSPDKAVQTDYATATTIWIEPERALEL